MAANIRLLRRRIKTAKNIAQITRAMEMVAASKVRRAQEKTVASKPYTQKLTSVVRNLVGRVEGDSHPYLTEKEEGKTLLLLFSSDKGLCGSFNTILLREYLRIERAGQMEVIAVGKKLQRHAARLGDVLIANFSFGTTLPAFENVLPISRLIVDGYTKGTYKKIICIYMEFVSISMQKPVTIVLLPIQRGTEVQEELVLPYTFEPHARELLTGLMPHFLEMSLYQILLESYASEQAGRMLAMHQASENAKDVIVDLSLTFNKVRQERITSELLDMSGGAVGAGI